VRILYVSRSSTGHDRRFLSAWRSAGFQVASVEISGVTAAEAESSERLIRAQLESFRPDLIQVGPVTHPASSVVDVWDGPLIATSWGFDLLLEAGEATEVEMQARKVLSRASLIFVDNDATVTKAESLGADPTRIVQFPWGLDSQWFAKRSSEPLSNRHGIEFLCTRRHEEIYRVDDVVSAFLITAARYEGIVLRLLGSGSLSPILKDKVATSEYAHRVSFEGEQKPEVLRAAYLRADAYITASSVDGTSVSLLEAMACGTPVVASGIPGNAQWVTEETGLTFDTGDVEELAEIMGQFASASPFFVSRTRWRARKAKSLVQRRANWLTTEEEFPQYARAALRNWEDDDPGTQR